MARPQNPSQNQQFQEDAIIKKIRILPQSRINVNGQIEIHANIQVNGQAEQVTTISIRFTDWAANIYGSPNNRAAIELDIIPPSTYNAEAQYIYFGEERFEENAIYAAKKTYHNTNGSRLTLENRFIYEVYNGNNQFNGLGNRLNINIRYRLAKINNQFARTVNHAINNPRHQLTYIYYDSIDNMHEVCSVERYQIIEKLRVANPGHQAYGRQLPAVDIPEVNTNPLSFMANRNAQPNERIDARSLTFYENGTLAQGDGGNRWYGNQANSRYMINMDFIQQNGVGDQLFQGLNYIRGNIIIAYSFQHTRRRYINPDCFAGLLGAIAQFREEGNLHAIGGQGFSYPDGSGYPSINHVNGEAGDLYYLRIDLNTLPIPVLRNAAFDYNNQIEFCNILFDFGWGRTATMISENFQNPAVGAIGPVPPNNPSGDVILPFCRDVANHDDHLHLEGFYAEGHVKIIISSN